MPTTNHPIVGTVRWNPVSPGAGGGPIQLLDQWEQTHIVTVPVPALQGVPTYGGVFSGKVRFFQGAASQLQAAWAEVQAQGLGNRVLFWEGSFVPRLIRGSATKPSNHAFGTAFDLNAAWNGLRVTPPAAGLKGSVRELVPIFEKHGFFWGGNYRERKDGMHFEVARLGPPAEAAAPLAVAICVNGVHEVIPALFLEGQTWVGVRALVKRLGGEIGQVTAQPFTVTVRNREVQTLAGQSRDGVGYVPFAEVIPLFGYPYEFHAGELRLDITVA